MDNVIKLTDDQIKLIEKFSALIQASGLQPAASRIMALLMVSDNPELNFNEIRDTLNLSKSATSNSLNMLLALNKISQVTKLGDRKRYFVMNIMHWADQFKMAIGSMEPITNILSDILKQRPGDTTEFNSEFKKLIDFYKFMNMELPKLFENWEQNYRYK